MRHAPALFCHPCSLARSLPASVWQTPSVPTPLAEISRCKFHPLDKMVHVPRHSQPALLTICSESHTEPFSRSRRLTWSRPHGRVATTQRTASLSLLPNNDGLRSAVHGFAFDGRFVHVEIGVSTQWSDGMDVYGGHVVALLHVDVTNCQHAKLRACRFGC